MMILAMGHVRKKLRWFSRLLARLEIKLWSPGLSRQVELECLNAEQLEFVTPCFVLSTGRCGTLWLTELLRLSRYAWVNHSDYPELVRHSRLAYEGYKKSPKVFCEILRATRDEYLLSAYKRGQIYVETNNRITFFAYAIKQVYPQAKFIHLVRHPGEFVRSGLRRRWYHNHPHDVGRIVDTSRPGIWQSMSDIEKIAWLWNETNQYIQGFLVELSDQDYLQIKAEDMFNDSAVSVKMCKFIGINDITPKIVSKMRARHINSQRGRGMESYQTWDENEKDQVRRHSSILAARYGYGL